MRRSLLTLLLSLASTVLAIPKPNPSLARPYNLLITPTPPSSSLPLCLLNSYFGKYGSSVQTQEHVYIPSTLCLELVASQLGEQLDSASITQLPESYTRKDEEHAQDLGDGLGEDVPRLVWIGPAGVSEDIAESMNAVQVWEEISTRSQTLNGPLLAEYQSKQISFSAMPTLNPTLLHFTSTSLIIQVPPHLLPILDTLLPSHYVPVGLPSQPFNDNNYDIPERYAKHLVNITKHLKFSPLVDQIVSTISLDEVRRSVRWLTGEAPSGIESRHSFTKGAIKAANWIKSKVEATGAECRFHHYLNGFAPNVICTYPSLLNSTEHIILSGHYDSRGSFGSTRAPGGDDDGSGSGHVLGIADAIKRNGIEFEKSVTLAFFSGEEQGLLGSHYYAQYLNRINATVILQIQADMLAYHAAGEPMQLGLPATIELPEAGWLVANLSKFYSPELVIGRTAACCSDHQSFVSYGFPATQVFERNGPIVDPMYHNSGDLSNRENYDFEQVISIAKVTFASLLTVAGFRVPTA